MKVLFIADRLFPQSLTGLSTFQWNLLKALLNIRGINVDVVFHAHRKDAFKRAWMELSWLSDEFKDIVQRSRVKVSISFRKHNTRNYTDKIRFVLNVIKSSKERYDYIVLAHGDLLVSLFLRQHVDSKLIIHTSTPYSLKFNRYLVKILNRINSNTIFAFTSKYLKSKYGTSGVIVPPPIDTDIFKPINPKPKENHVLYIGPLTPRRFPYKVILKAIYLLKRRFNILVHLTIRTAPWRMVKERIMLSNIVSYAKMLGIEKQLSIGFNTMSYKDKVKLYNEHALLIELLQEPLDFVPIDPPYVILEAMACGTAVMVTNVLSFSEFICDGYNGFIINKLSVEEVAKKLCEALMSLQKCWQCLKTINELFSLKKISRRLKVLLEAIS